ncbi:MAG: HPF/RaiA family ribosome-associated protein [Gemmatimonadaceae bacterium]|nr:HPF/RaiA family ribosome-associated protein [Gemmatimonadaceae bacterium]
MFHSSHADISEAMQRRTGRQVEKLALRLPRAVGAVVRFEEDGPERRVEIVLSAPRHTRLVASATGRHFGPLVTEVIARLTVQADKEKRDVKHRAARERAKTVARG